jgi:1,2-diacylglycerol 3-alpha-glucosyltransferase
MRKLELVNDSELMGADSTTPFENLMSRQGRPLRIAILSDFTRISYANGAAFQTQFLYQELRRCGHTVTVIGPKDPDTKPGDLAPGTVELPSMPMKMYPGLHLPLPLESWVFDPTRWDFDIVFAQTTSLLLEFGCWLRNMLGIPLLCVNTTHLAAAYDVLLPEKLAKYDAVHTGLQLALKKPYEKYFASIYNDSDGLVVLSEGLRTYWRERGVTAPIHVISRAVKPEVFDRNLGDDPYTFLNSAHGPRLLCAGRHTREKEQDRAIRIFARHVLPHAPGATLTLLGIGPDTEFYKRVAKQEGVEGSVHFPGEVPFTSMPDYYAYADLFVHTSRSETYGNVLGEALWCGTPTVAFADGMGVSAQVQDNVNGLLLGSTAQDGAQADAAFGAAVVRLLGDETLRARLGKAAAKFARERSSPLAVEHKIAEAFKSAQDHAQRAGLRPAATGPRALRWLTTFSHFRRWAFFNGALVAVGHMRRPHAATLAEHPQIHG